MRTWTRLTNALLVASLLSACSGSSNSVDDTSSDEMMVLDRAWNLVTYTDLDGVDRTPIDGTYYQFRASSDPQVLGSYYSCNLGGQGTYSIGDGFIDFLTFGDFDTASCDLEDERQPAQSRAIGSLIFGFFPDEPDNSMPLMISFEGDSLVLTSVTSRRAVFTEVSRLGLPESSEP